MGITADVANEANWASGGRIDEPPPAIIRNITEFENPEIGVVGSGSSWESFFSNLSGSLVLVLSPEPPALSSENQMPAAGARIAEVLDTIRRAFGLTWDELARACGKERRTLYNWRDGLAEPRPASAERLFMLYRAARDWQSAGYPTPSRAMLRAPMLGDQSLFDLLTAHKIERDAIDYIGSGMAIDGLEGQPLADPFA